MRVYDVIVIGAGASGMMAAISSAGTGNTVLLLEKLPKIGAKLKATGGGRCNLTNTLPNDRFIDSFGKDGRFMTHALELMDHKSLQEFFSRIGVATHAPDGFHIFPVGHKSSTIISALKNEMEKLGVETLCSQRAIELMHQDSGVTGVRTNSSEFHANNIIIATGGMGYPALGSQGDGYELARNTGHKITDIYPAMMPLKTKEKWVSNCRADTIANATLTVNIKKYKKFTAKGDLIFTKDGIRGPVVLDFSRDITPLLSTLSEVPISINMIKGMNEESLRRHINQELAKNPHRSTLELIQTLLPLSVATQLCHIAEVDTSIGLGKIGGAKRDGLIRLLVSTPLSIIGHNGFDMAMITRGGVSLSEIYSETMQSKRLKNLYYCGEVLNLDGPCGGYNLQWAFSSGYLAGISIRGTHSSNHTISKTI